MNQVQAFRENTRRLEMNLSNINKTGCCSVSEAQCFALVEIGRNPMISVKELAKILGVDKSGTSRNVEELVQKGFVERTPSKEDRRFVVLELTDNGKERFRKTESDMNDKFGEILNRIPEDKRDSVIEALRLYNEAFGKSE